MAIGVPDTEVFAAADRVLARGERPTVERVRVELGRGSPARVGQLIEQWWEQLARRLKGHALLPELPGEVAQAFAEAWRLALTHAGTAADAALSEQQNAVFAAQMELTQERKLWEIALASAQVDLAEGANKLAQAELQLAERQALIDQLGTEVADGRHQRELLQGQLERRQAELDGLRADHAATQAHVRTVEDRAHQQVDQARQEMKALGQQHERARREHAKQIAESKTQREALQAALQTAEQAAAHRAGQVSALEATIANWPHLPPAASTRARRKTTIQGATKTSRPARPRRKT